MRRIKALLLAIILITMLGACREQETILTGDEKDAVLAFSESKTDDLLAAMNANDYTAFSQSFDKEMLAAMPQEQFDALKADRDAKLGLYVSRIVGNVLYSGDFYTVVYDARFEKEESVYVRVVFRVSDPHQISGLWFSK